MTFLNHKKSAICILALLVCFNILAWYGVWNINSQKFLEIVFFDIGQGDAIFIQTSQKHQILIDGGPDSTILEKLTREMPYYDRTIDLIILTHSEHDHIAGLIEVLKSYKVENVLWTAVAHSAKENQKWRDLIEKEKTNIIIAQAGQKIIIESDKQEQIYFEILWPFDSLEEKEMKNINNTSIVSRLVFKNNSFLFTGDIFKSIEKKLIKNEIFLDSDVLKIGHHGSKTSSSLEFIQAVSPEIAVIQCGRNNRYGHPHKETLAILEKFDIIVLRTDKEKDIKIISDGNNLRLKN